MNAIRPLRILGLDPGLRKTAAQFSSDAAKRHYEADAPRGGETIGRAQVGYTMNVLEIANLSDVQWENVEIWVNQQYVVFVPKFEAGKLRSINFQMLYNDKGEYFPLDNSKVLISKVEIMQDGKMYEIPVHAAL